MRQSSLDLKEHCAIPPPEEVARFLRKSKSWVYRNWRKLGGRKLGGSLFFPRKEELYELLFYKRERVEVRLHSERDSLYKGLVQDKGPSKTGRGKKKGGDRQTEDPNRHKLFRSGK